MNDLLSNVPEYSVSEISGAVKRTLEGAFGQVRVRGEITEYKRYPSGHAYFALKDEGGKIKGIVWKTNAGKLGLVPENGVEVIASGRITTYGDRSEYQLIVERMAYAGAGAMLARIELLRVRLAAEGLFGEDRKRRLPVLPTVVGVVTSAAGAVLQDIKTTILRRFPRPILVWPVPVQGEGAAARIAGAIAGFDRLPAPGVPRPDVLIVARGGGSLEDLMAFNDEAVVRAAAACRIPLISAVGHETDHTLIDLASDRRAPTPTAAAELAVPSRAALVATVAQEQARLGAGLLRLSRERRLRLGQAERGLPHPAALAARARGTFMDRAERMRMALPNLLAARRSALHRADRLPDLPGMIQAAHLAIETRRARLRLALPSLVRMRREALMRAERSLPPPHGLLQSQHGRVVLATSQLTGAVRHATQRRLAAQERVLVRLSPAPLWAAVRESRARLDGTAARLRSVSPMAVLARGYALVTDADGHAITAAAALRDNQRVELHFADGLASAAITPRRLL